MPRPPNRSPLPGPWVPRPGRWLPVLLLLCAIGGSALAALAASAAPAAPATTAAHATRAAPATTAAHATRAAPASPPRSLADITDATTGLPDASSVVAVDACGKPTATRAACLAQTLAVRGTHALVHPRLRRPPSPYRLGGGRAHCHAGAASPAAGASHATVVSPNATAVSPNATAVAPDAPPQPGTPAYLQQAYDLAYFDDSDL